MNSPDSAYLDLKIADLFENPKLRKYLTNVRNWHGYIRFLGLPDRRDNPDILIDRLFVEPLLTRRHVSPDESPSDWLDEAETIFDALERRKPVVLLGDPGTGKSTLVNYLVWLLARPAQQEWTKRLGAWLLPIPMVLRELHLHDAKDFEGLLDAFLSHPMSEPIRDGEYVRQSLLDGNTFILLDGIDEIGNMAVRKRLRDAVFDGFVRYPECRWLLSSRIVGYDDVPFGTKSELAESLTRPSELPHKNIRLNPLHSNNTEMLTPQELSKVTRNAQVFDDSLVVTRYLAPFDDQRIEAFARNWYVQREAAATRAGEDAMHLVRAVKADDAILRLARTPNLLTMMALIHRVEATLPHGRALLYDRITEAYLESIDKFRGVYSGAYNLPQKKRWLARIGYEMQRRRKLEGSTVTSELLVSFGEVTGWLDEEIERAGTSEGLSTPEEFIDYIGRRSGLFLPRGQDRYAFVHLSFQEYFAAVALEREVTGIDWARRKSTPLKMNRKIVANWAGQSIWRETIAFLFELLASKEDWHDDLLDSVFGAGFKLLAEVPDKQAVNLAQLLARLCVNPRSGLIGDKRHDAVHATVRLAFKQQSDSKMHWRETPTALVELLGEDAGWNRIVLDVIRAQLKESKLTILSLASTSIQDMSLLSDFDELESLILRATRVSDLGPVAKLTNLQSLDLAGTRVSDLGPVAKLTNLQSLDLAGTRVSDLGPVAKLTNLQSLDLAGTEVVDLGPVAKLTNLQSLGLAGPRVSDLGPVAKLTNLQSLYLVVTEAVDLVPVAKLRGLRSLSLTATVVVDLDPVVKLTSLESLFLSCTEVVDLCPLVKLTSLESLYLFAAEVVDLGPVAKLTSLDSLFLSGIEVVDLGPVAKLTGLRTLFLSGTEVVDLGPVGKLTGLESLFLPGAKVVDLGPLAKLAGLHFLDLSGTNVSNLRPLAALKGLRVLRLQRTEVSENEINALRKTLPQCEIV